MGRTLTRLAMLVPLLVLGSTVVATASADVPPLPATLSAVKVTGQSLTGNLTVRSGETSVLVDPQTVTAVVDGEQTRVTITPASQETRSTMILVDTSGSMGAPGMATVRAAVHSFLAAVPKDVRVGVAHFSDKASVDLAPTLDRQKAQKAVDSLSSKGETALFAGVQAAISALGNSGDRSFVLLSDGGDTIAKDPAAAQRAAVAAIAAHGVRVEAIRFKSNEGNDAVLQTLANAGGGSVAAANDSAAVTSAFTAAAVAFDSQYLWGLTLLSTHPGHQTVTLTGLASGRNFTATTAVDFAAVTTPTVAPTTAPATVLPTTPSGGGWHLWAAVAAVFLGVAGLAIAFQSSAFRSKRSERVSAIEQYASGTAFAKQIAARQTNPSVLAEQLIHMGDRVMEGRESTSRTMALMDRADLPWRAGEWFVLRIVAVITGGAAGYLLLNRLSWAGLLIGLALGFVLPAVALRFLARRRANKFESNLPDVLMLVATSLSSGFSLSQALDAVARDAPEPTSKEFSRALAETRIGSDMADALDKMANRMGSENMTWATMAIRIQRQVGGNLAETLRTTAKTLRERESLRRQVRALSAEGRLSAYILIALPILIFVYTIWVNYDYEHLLWTSFLGIAMLIFAVVDMIVGVFWMRKVVQIEV